jgi:hypothetical protein
MRTDEAVMPEKEGRRRGGRRVKEIREREGEEEITMRLLSAPFSSNFLSPETDPAWTAKNNGVSPFLFVGSTLPV